MRLISSMDELKKGDTVIVKDHAWFESLGFAKVFGDIYSIEAGGTIFTIKCEETNSIEEVNIENGKIFLLN